MRGIRHAALVIGLAAAGFACAAAPTIPAGWALSAESSGRQVYAPAVLPPGEETAVVLEARVALGAASLAQWATQAMLRDAAPAGSRWSGEPVVKAENASVVSGQRAFRDATGNIGLAIYLAFDSAGQQARLSRWTANSEATARRHEAAASMLMKQFIALEKATPPPVREVGAKKPAERQPDRYAWTTAPGQGVKAADIEAVTYAWKQVYTATGLQIIEDVYLLLADGTVHDGLPVPPQDLDVAASRRYEPKRWGRWKKQGGGYLFAWPAKPDEFRSETVEVMRPGPAGRAIDGRWQGASSYDLPGVATTWAQYDLRLAADGRFEQGRFGGSSVGGRAGRTQSMTVYDEKGATGTSAGPGFVVGSSSRNADQGDTRGTYRFEGYAIVLQYDNGTTERQPYFQTDDMASAVYFGGALMTRPSPAKK